MRTIVKGKNAEVPDRVREYAERKLRRTERLLDDQTDATVELWTEHHKSAADTHIVEVTLIVHGRVLRSRGHVVKVCDSVASATSAVQSEQLDLLVSDIGLPDGTGLDLIRQVRRQHKIPAIALTGYGMDDDIARCRDAGFDGHLTKPISFEKLEAMIGQFTNN